MVKLKSGMDPHSLEITREGKHVGYIQWHPNREPHITLTEPFSSLTLVEVESLLALYCAHRKTVRPTTRKLVRQPWMSDKVWEQKVNEFKKAYSHEEADALD